MKAAFSVWDTRIAPLLDTARNLHLVECREGEPVCETDHLLADDLPQRCAWLAEQDLEVLVCGAVSRPLQEQLAAAHIRLIPFVAGDVREVIRAWQNGTLHGSAFTMPGCCGRRRMRAQHGGGRCCAARRAL